MAVLIIRRSDFSQPDPQIVVLSRWWSSAPLSVCSIGHTFGVMTVTQGDVYIATPRVEGRWRHSQNGWQARIKYCESNRL